MSDHDPHLDDFFEAARSDPPQPSADLMGRVRRDADSVMGRAAPAQRQIQRPSFMQRFMALWPVWSVSVPAGLVGLWIGFYPPDTMPDPALWLSNYVDPTSELLTDYADWSLSFEEGQL